MSDPRDEATARDIAEWSAPDYAPELVEKIAAALTRARREGLEEAAQLVEERVKAYPPDVFREPPPGEHGKTVDACSARALRVMAPLLAADIRATARRDE